MPVLRYSGRDDASPELWHVERQLCRDALGPQTQPVTVLYTTMDGTATTGRDYLPQTGTLTFSPGVTQMTIAVAIVGSPLAEAHNQFYVDLSSPVGATLDIGAG